MLDEIVEFLTLTQSWSHIYLQSNFIDFFKFSYFVANLKICDRQKVKLQKAKHKREKVSKGAERRL